MDTTPEDNQTQHHNEGGYVQMPGEGRTIQVGEITIVFKADSTDTQGVWSLAEYTVPPGNSGPPPHCHEAELQAFYVLSGTVTFYLGKRTIRLPAGSFVLVPPSVAHTLRNEDVVPATVLLLASPGGAENYFEALAEMIEHEATWPPADTSRWRALMESYGRHSCTDIE